MAYKCDWCGKGKMIGRQHKHHPGVAGGRWKKRAQHTLKIFKPNLHAARILIDGSHQRLKLCTKCLRRAKAASKAVSASNAVDVKPSVEPRVLTA